MSNQEMLELAAKATGHRVTFGPSGDPYIKAGINTRAWNPLIDDGDALRLAVKLGINVFLDDDEECSTEWNSRHEWACVEFGDDKYAAVRLAIVRAAAEIGKKME